MIENDGKRETALYVACGLYRHTYDRLAIVQKMVREDPESPESKRMMADAIGKLVRRKEDLRKALDGTQGGEG